MNAFAAFGVALVFLTLSVCLKAEPRVVLTVRLYNASGIPAPELLAARRAAASAFLGTGVDVTFRHCGRSLSSQDPAAPCDQPLKPLEVVVRVIDAPAFSTNLHPDAFGMAYLVRETDRGWLATVFSDRIDGAAGRVGVEPGTLLGLVMAHEVGHLLLGTDYHGESGVMRADWPDALLNRASAQWRFSTLESARMREAASTGF